MTIQGGGKLPPSQGGRVDRPRRAAEKRQVREATAVAHAEKAEKATADVFESGSGSAFRTLPTPAHGIHTPASPLANTKLDDLANPSQIKAMAEAITAHAKKLGAEFDSLRGTAQDVVGKLAQAGFSAEAVGESKEQLNGLRRQMAGLRGKIAADGRRLKLLKASAHRLGETRLSDRVSGQIRRISDMEKGWGRAFLALGIAGTFAASPNDTDVRASRVNVGGADASDKHRLGSYMASNSPGTAASQLLVALLEEGPHAPSGRLIADAYAELHADVLAGRFGKSLQGLGLWRQAMG